MQKLLTTLAEKQVRIEVRDGRLHVHAAPGVITPELQLALSEHRDAMIRHLDAQSGVWPAEEYPTVVENPEDAYRPFPLNPVQHAYWFGRSGHLALGGTSTHVYMEFACERDIDPPRLSAAFQQVIARHGMLRAVVDSDGRQRILPEVDAYEIGVHDLSGLEGQQRAAELERVRKDLSELVIPSERWPLYVVRLIKISSGDWRLCMAWDFLTVDVWSMMIILREWSRFDSDTAFRPEPLTLSFRDYLLAEEKCRELHSYERAQRYWLDRIDDLPGPPLLPQSKAKPGKRYVLKRRTMRLEKAQWVSLKSRARSYGITPSNLLLAAFSEVLAYWSGNPRFCVNLTLFNRLPLHEQASAIVGDFTTLMLVEVDASRGGTFRERAGRVQEQCLRDLEHRQFGAVDVIRELNRSRAASLDASFPIVFTSTLMLDGTRGESSDAFGAFGPMVFGISQTPQVSLDCQIFEIGGELRVNWDASDALFEPGVLDAMFGAYARLIDALAADAAVWERTDVAEMPPSQQTVRARVNATEAATPNTCLHEPFVANALRDPSRPAVECGERSLTYGALLANSNRIASQLIAAGAEPGTLVAICGDRGPEQIVAIMAAMLAGMAYLPVDARWPALRREQVLTESDARIVLALAGFPDDALPDDFSRMDVRIDPDCEMPTDAPPRRQSPEDLAYVIFTSGSTGRPKGVMIDHSAAVNTVAHINRMFCLSAGDKVLAVSDLGFDLSVYDVFGTLAAGGTLVVPEPSLGRDPGHWHTLIRRASVTVWNSAPQLMNMLVDFAQSVADGAMPSLRLALLSGDWIPVGLPERLRKVAKDIEIVSLGGATECAIWSIHFPIGDVDGGWQSIPYGTPLPNQRFHVLDAALRPLPDWVAGDLYIGGSGLAQGYWKDEEKTRRSFIVDPVEGERLYHTGDKGRYRADGVIEFLGREDLQVKVRGNRVELGEISAVLATHAKVHEAAVRMVADDHGSRLIGYAVPATSGAGVDEDALRAFLAERLPDYMVPAHILVLESLPLSSNGKLLFDRLPVPQDNVRGPQDPITLPRSDTERCIWNVWCRVLGKDLMHIRANFFEAGGDSLRLMEVMNELNAGREQPLSINELLQYPTIESLAEHLDVASAGWTRRPNISYPSPSSEEMRDDDVAVIGMAGRFPDADSVDALWANVVAGRCAVRQFSDEALRVAGVDPQELAAPNYVKSGVVLSGIDQFDAGYFDVTPADAAIMDPQQRLLLECATTALEDAGYADERSGDRIGVFVGKGTNFYLYEHLIGNRELAKNADVIGILSLNEPDYAGTLLSYKLGLTGPSLGINTACSTSLVAVHEACRSLTRSRDCEIALAGGVTLASTVSPSGYPYITGHITSPDGYCRAFADDAQGCTFGSGVGLVVLKPLKRALEDRDTVLAVIKGSAINNDGALKLGFTAPSAQGQARAIADAMTGCDPDSIQSIEAHGTGTTLGDPVEFEGLRAVFGGPRKSGERCALGSIKTNIGHLGSASGIAGLIKMVQSLRHRQIPPSLHAAVPSSRIDFADSPFFVNGELRDWPAPASGPRRGGVSSFGVGGTNAHVVVEEAPAEAGDPAPLPARGELLLISARSAKACRQAANNLAAALRDDPGLRLADVAYTLQVGRKAHEWRSAIVWGGVNSVAREFDGSALPMREFTRRQTPQVVFALSGEGIASADALRAFHTDEAAFRFAFDRCADVLRDIAAYDLREFLASHDGADSLSARTSTPRQRLGLQFASEYALARMWLSLGVKPAALLGRALGECVAACLAGVFSLETALRLVDAQARFLLPDADSRQCIVDASADRIQTVVEGTACRIATVESPRRCSVSGPSIDMEALSRRLESLGVGYRWIAFTGICIGAPDAGFAAYAEVLSDVTLREPTIPLVLSSDESERRQPTDRRYWERQPGNVVQFHAATRKIDRIGDPILLSIGACAAYDGTGPGGQLPIASVASNGVERAARSVFLEALGVLWMSGVEVDWSALHVGQAPRRVSLPAYPFQRSRYWIERSTSNRLGAAAARVPLHRVSDADAAASEAERLADVPTSFDRERIQAGIAAIWKGVLGMPDIDVNDNFFDIGGNSLAATSIFARIKGEFGVELPLDKMFEFATIRQTSLFVLAKLDPGIVDRLSPDELQEMLVMTED